MGLFSSLFGSKARERETALQLGLSVSEVERDLIHLSRHGKLLAIKPAKCVRYAMTRRSKGLPDWSLLQRTPDSGANFTNGYLLTSSGSLPDGLEQLLQEVAEIFTEELFEFEGNRDEVAVYWEEWGGEGQVRQLYAYLERLAAY